MDKNIVVGLFTWDTGAPEHNYREIDIEFSRWGQTTNDNAQYVIQPYTEPRNMKRFSMELNGDYSTHMFEWKPDSIFLQSIHGQYVTPPDTSYLIESWIYTGKDIPPAGNENVRQLPSVVTVRSTEARSERWSSSRLLTTLAG